MSITALPPTIAAERVNLRHAVFSDLPAIYQIHKHEVVNKYLPYQTWQRYQDALDWYERVCLCRAEGDAEQYVIESKTDDTLVGTCIVFGLDTHKESVEIGYVLHPDCWGKGLMREALDAFIPRLRNSLSITSVAAKVEKPNHASLKLLDGLNFKEITQTTDDEGIELIHLRYKFSKPQGSE